MDRRRFRTRVALALCLLLLAGTAAEAGQIRQFRVRIQTDSADLEREDGTVFIGDLRGKRKTAQLRITPEGRTREGTARNLSELLLERGGKVLRAWWRAEAKEARPGGFLLWPEGNRMPSMVREGADGWNLWDVTEWMGPALAEGTDFSFRVQTADGGGGGSADFNFSGSRIYVTLYLEEGDPALEEEPVTDSDLLDIAFSALPEDHWALRRYREVSGSLTRAGWPETGVPYYFGGHSADKVLHRFFPLQESRYYKSSRLYLCGFDCGSFLHWVEETGGYAPHEDLSEILKKRADAFPLAGTDVREWRHALVPGDILVFNHGTYHAGMYLGTPAMYGLTEENAPELKEWLDAPMMIHCGEDPFCYDRFKAYIDGQDWRMTTSPPDGGVTVSLIVPAVQDAPRIREAPWGKKYGYFILPEQQMTAFPLSDCTETAWFRPVRP